MRIVGGDHKGRNIIAPKGKDTRPTSDRAREAMFNMLQHATWGIEFDNVRVIDLFAGTGALGLEAMSRGASFCLFIETEAAPRGALRENLESLDLFGHTRIHRRDATMLGKLPRNMGEKFDIAFIDPPYNKGLGVKCLRSLRLGEWLNDDAIIVLEVGVDEEPVLSKFEVLDERTYGAAKIYFMRALKSSDISTDTE